MEELRHLACLLAKPGMLVLVLLVVLLLRQQGFALPCQHVWLPQANLKGLSLLRLAVLACC